MGPNDCGLSRKHIMESINAVLTAVQRLVPVAQEAGLSLAQLAVAWVLQHDFISTAILGASRPEQLEENVKACGVTLGAQVMEAIDAALGDVVERNPNHSRSPKTRPC
ncbi:aldo/keto reductase [Actinomyces trachealis]|nr:aldo/keto reductase [Actinomyces trachealis]